jgi:hypothetical protein
MSDVTLDDIVVRIEAILSADTGAEVLALDEQSGNCFSLAGSGRLIWEYAKQPVRVRDICSQLQDHYKVDEATCTAETLAYIKTLVAEKLMLVAPTETKG